MVMRNVLEAYSTWLSRSVVQDSVRIPCTTALTCMEVVFMISISTFCTCAARLIGLATVVAEGRTVGGSVAGVVGLHAANTNSGRQIHDAIFIRWTMMFSICYSFGRKAQKNARII